MTIASAQADINARVITGMTTAVLRSVLSGMLVEVSIAQSMAATETARASAVEGSLGARVAALETGGPVVVPSVAAPGYPNSGVLDPYWRHGNFRGVYTSLAVLAAAVPEGVSGDYAVLLNGPAGAASLALWDADRVPAAWIVAGGDVAAQIAALEAGLLAETAAREAADVAEVAARDTAIAAAITALIAGAGAADDTLKELADKIALALSATWEDGAVY